MYDAGCESTYTQESDELSRMQVKELVAFEAQETETYIYRRGKPLAQDTGESWYKYNTAGRICENKRDGDRGSTPIQ